MTAASNKDLLVAVITVAIVFFYRLNVMVIAMTRYYESRTKKV